MPYRRYRQYLFSDGDLSATLRAHFEKISDRVAQLSEAELMGSELEDLRNQILPDFLVAPLAIDLENQSISREEIQVDVTGDGSRYFSSDRGPHYVPGTRLSFEIPFTGDPMLWKLKPDRWQSVFPYGIVRSSGNDSTGVLEVIVDFPSDVGPERAKETFDRNLRSVNFYLDSQRTQVEAEMSKLPGLIDRSIESRKQRIAKSTSSLEDIFGAPVKARTAPPKIPNEPKPIDTSGDAPTLDVFISHASEDKDDFARPLARALRDEGLSVWFDEFELSVGDSLRRSIDRGLASARFGIVIISKHFLAKEWPQKELDALVGRESDGVKVILPVWHKVDVKNVRKYSPMLADRLAAVSSSGIEAVVADLIEAIRKGR